MKRVVLDQGCPRSTADILNLQGWDVLHVSDIGLSRATDLEILNWAKEHDRVCVTLDADFHAHLATTNACKPSTVRIRVERLNAELLAALLVKIWPKIGAVIDSGVMVSVTQHSVRLRRLPIS